MTVTDSPYAGPQPLRTTDRLYGRDVELAELESLLVAQRIVLLYAVSGVGKTSLLQAGAEAESPAQAGLHRRVKDRFQVTHISGFSDMQPASANEVNPYIAHVRQELQGTKAREPLDHPRQRRTLLIIDQFEELFPEA